MVSHLKLKFRIFLIGAVFFSQTGMAALYPQVPQCRSIGIDQGETHRCFGTAVVTAYEHAFEIKGYPVKLSAPHIQVSHAVHNLHPSVLPTLNMDLTAEDEAFVDRTGYLLPHYFWPEDLWHVNEQNFNIRARNSTHLANLPAELATEFQLAMSPHQKQLTYLQGLSDSVDVTKLKLLLKNGEIITLPIAIEMFQFFDHKTGLINADREEQTQVLVSVKPLHMAAVVGFDDDLYQGEGAFIIKNTWDNYQKRKVILEALTEEELPLFQSFRAKISPQNQPGYYALPYWQIEKWIELTASSAPSENWAPFIHPLPSYADFFEKYARYEQDYPVFLAPFACKSPRLDQLLSHFKFPPSFDAAGQQRNQLKAKILDLQMRNPKGALFNLAQFSSQDDLLQFYENSPKFLDHYCPGGEIFPSLEQIRQLSIFSRILSRDWAATDLSFWAQFYNQVSLSIQ